MSQTAQRLDTQGEEVGYGQPLPVKYSRIRRYEGQPRRFFDEKSLEELADDIQKNKQTNPVRVCKHSKEKGVFVLIGGERRWRAFGLIAERTGTDPIVKCFIDTMRDERHHYREALRDNLQREDLIPVDEAASYQRLYDESTKGSHNAKIVEIADFLKKSTTHVENYLFLHSLSDEVKKLLDPRRDKERRLTVTAAIDIARSTSDQELRLELAQEAIERNLGIAEVRMLIQTKTGKSGFGVGGRLRKPSDDYKAFKNFLGATKHRADRILSGIDIDDLYLTRIHEKTERTQDAHQIDAIIVKLEKMKQAITGKK